MFKERTLRGYINTAPADYHNQYGLIDVWPKIPVTKTFSLKEIQGWQGNYKLKNPIYMLYCQFNDTQITIGRIKSHLINGIILEIDNALLYSKHLDLIYDFEKLFNCSFRSIKDLDICCDANIDLPRKLKCKLQNKNTKVSRPGSKKKYETKKGNLIRGRKNVEVIKIITEPERMSETLFFDYRPSGSKQKIELVGYNKSEEIESSKKEYIKSKLSFTGKIHRLEFRLKSSHLTWLSKKYEITHAKLYLNLQDKDLLKFVFITILNRLFTVHVKNMKTTVSKILCLD